MERGVLGGVADARPAVLVKVYSGVHFGDY
jgi:hypothetical protein